MRSPEASIGRPTPISPEKLTAVHTLLVAAVHSCMRAFRLAYDGRPFYGYQRQPDVPTIEETLFDALRSLGVMEAVDDKPAGYAAAGRTDRGVSALSQTVAFDAPTWLTPRALNSELPKTIRAWASAEAPNDFHATHHAVRRTYQYSLYAPHEGDRRTGHDAVVDERAKNALERLCGSHDFHNLTPDATGTWRGLSGRMQREGSFLQLWFAAGGFPRELVRRLVTVVHSVADGSMPIDRVDRLLSEESVDGRYGVAPAPPEPLILTDVTYPQLRFASDPDACTSSVRAFSEASTDAQIRHRTAETIATQIEHGCEY